MPNTHHGPEPRAAEPLFRCPPLEASSDALRERVRAVVRADLAGVERADVADGVWDTVFLPSPSVTARALDQETVLLNLDTGRCYTLNPVGTFVWDQLDGAQTLEDAMEALVACFGVEERVARRDVAHLMSQLLEERLVEVVP